MIPDTRGQNGMVKMLNFPARVGSCVCGSQSQWTRGILKCTRVVVPAAVRAKHACSGCRFRRFIVESKTASANGKTEEAEQHVINAIRYEMTDSHQHLIPVISQRCQRVQQVDGVEHYHQ